MRQDKALAILKSGKNVFLTGSAGTGKTHVINEYIKYLKERNVSVAITASTGIAATHMNGMTIHSWSGIGIKEYLTQANLVSLKSKKYLKKHLEKAKILIIDEISMLHKTQLDMVNRVLQYFKDNTAPFGGIQIILSGDFFQLPPIGKSGENSRDKFSFMADAWLNAELKVCYLTEQYRQNDTCLSDILNEIRKGEISKKSIDLLLNTKKNKIQNKVDATKLYTHNYNVDKINNDYLSTLKGKSKIFKATTKGNLKLIDTLKNSVLAGELLELKMGAKVMFIKNNVEKGYVNGTTGKVIGFSDSGFPIVKILNGRSIIVEQEIWTIQDDHGKILASFNQFPLRLAWAITIHKSQGMTLDEAEIDLSKTFEKGQGYVALSRLKNIQSLQLNGFNDLALRVDSLAFKADIRFQELSKEVDRNFTYDELNAIAPIFIKNCGGTNKLDEIKKNRSKINLDNKREKKSTKQSTYTVTMAYLKQKKSIAEIAKERGLSKGTISGHLIKICKDHPKEDLNFYKPKKSILEKVRKLYHQQPKGKPISLKIIYDGLGGKISYENIKLSIAFL